MGEQMSFADFVLSSAKDASPPSELGAALAALWHDRRGNWDHAHQSVQELSGGDGAWVHAYLHRKEGDKTNAAYWYRLSGRALFEGSIDDEWAHIARALLEKRNP